MARPVRVYIANSAGDDIAVIDTDPHGIVPSPDKSRFYVTSETENVLDVVDRKTSKVTFIVSSEMR